MKRVTWSGRHKFFRQGFNKGEICTYSSDFYFRELEIYAKHQGVTIRHCKIGTPERKEYGPCFEILDGPLVYNNDGKKKEQIFHYDIKQLM